MHVRVIHLAAVFLLVTGGAKAAAEPDFASADTISLEVKARGDGMSLTETSEHILILLTDKATERKTIVAREPTFGELKDFRLYINGKKLSGSKIRDVYPRSEDIFFPEKRLKVALLPDDLSVGDTIRYHYRVEYDDATSIPMFIIGNNDVNLSGRFSLKHPKGWTPHFQFSFVRDSLPVSLVRESDREIVLLTDSIPYLEPEPYLNYADYHAIIMIGMTDDEGRSRTPANERDFSAWYGGLTSLRPDLTSDSVPPQLRMSDETAQEYLSRINDFVRERIRYVAIAKVEHAIVPDKPDVVLGRMWGDCKDRAALVTALSREEGLDVNMALVGPGTSYGLSGVHLNMFNHVICHWIDGGEDVFFDPTARYRGWRDLSESLIDCRALVLDPDNPRFVTMRQPVTAPFVDIRLAGSLDSLSSVRATIELRSSAAVDWHYIKAQLDPSNEGTTPEDWLSGFVRGVRFDKPEQVADSDGVVVLTTTTNLSRFLIPSEGRVYVPSTLYPVVDNEVFRRETDSLPLEFVGRDWLRTELLLRAPGYAGADSLVLSIDDVYCDSRMSTSDSDDVRITWEYRRLAKSIVGAPKNSFLALCREYLASRNRLFVLREEES